MAHHGALLPAGYSQLRLTEIDSTNSEALRRAGEGAGDRLWVTALAQTAGRGRQGRNWESRSGNLFASLLLRPRCPLGTSVQLAFVAGVALFECVAAVAGGLAERLAVKWPNDLLLDGKKLGGILLESNQAPPNSAPAIVIGTGVNLASHPELSEMPATDLISHDVAVSPDAAFTELAGQTARWLDIWARGEGWDTVRNAWAERSLPAGSPIRVRTGDDDIEGSYAGVDETGALIVTVASGEQIKLNAGDVFLL
ncbi:MAG: biotin--[acetyl-CoA-carboxylase] ligase [Hyphomicrobiales bacterium]|nr:biotin--[acetyl-CoA-carboxylase] ligase [Hyphomicrobiales bacterium]